MYAYMRRLSRCRPCDFIAHGGMTLEWTNYTHMIVGPNSSMTVLKCQIDKTNNSEMSVL